MSVGQSKTTYFLDHRFNRSIFCRNSIASLALFIRLTISTWNVSFPGFSPWYICCSLKSPVSGWKEKVKLYYYCNCFLNIKIYYIRLSSVKVAVKSDCWGREFFFQTNLFSRFFECLIYVCVYERKNWSYRSVIYLSFLGNVCVYNFHTV